MRPLKLIGAIAAFLVTCTLVEARPVHYFDCKNCHTASVSLFALGQAQTNLCMKCHKPSPSAVQLNDGAMATPTGVFHPNDASNAMGSAPAGLDPTQQTSHFWASPTDKFPAAGALAPTRALYYSRYGISNGKITCTRCHDPHQNEELNPKLLRMGNGSTDAMCLDCHRPWNMADNNGLQTHPMVADYDAAAAANPGSYRTLYNSTTGLLDSNVDNGEVRLVKDAGTGKFKVTCTSCHGAHFADSHSGSADGMVNANTPPGLKVGDGKLLRSDGPLRSGATAAETAQLRSNLCQACHTYGRHGVGRTNPIGCLDCHSGHSYDPVSPNYYVLRSTVENVYLPKSGATGSATLGYKTLNADWYNAGGGGLCQQCHTLALPHNGLSAGGKAECGTCHGHKAANGSFAANCTGCHGYPPSQNVAGGTPNSGYAYISEANNYTKAANWKDESLTAHVRHAGTAQYKMTCDRCHNGIFAGGKHNNGNYQDVYFDALSSTGLAPAYDPAGSAGNGQCSNIYCHSNGGARTGDATRSYVAAAIPAWEGGDIAGCTSCHGNSAATMAGKNSATHQKHLNKGYSCNVCHEGTASNSTTLASGAMGGAHVNGAADVDFQNSYDLGALTLGQGTSLSYGTDGTCGIYCHSNGKTQYATPDWDVASSGACGTCHKLDVASGNAIVSGTHTTHINDSDSEIGRNVGCAECHANTVSSNTVIGTQANHVNGAVNLGIAFDGNKTACSNISCHSNGNYDGALVYKAAGTDYVWGGPALAGCDDCHGDGAGKAYPTYANGGSGSFDANSHPAHMVGAGATCGDCHSETSTAGTAINGTAPTKHVNKAIDVKGAKINSGSAGSFNSTSKTCSSVSCHGGNSPVWGDTLGCGDCHTRSAGDADDFTYGNGTLAMVDQEEWLYSGHGKAFGTYDVTGRAAANFAGTDPCLYCHDDSLSHGGANYFRLRLNGKPDLNGACLGCHGTGSAGVDPDGAATDYALRTSAVKVDKYHGGAKHDGATGRDAGRWCWDCHDPHGDADTAGLRIQMIQRRLAVNPDDNGKPASLTDTDIIFTDRTVGAGAGGFARDSADPAVAKAGVCNACHTQTVQYKIDLGANGHPMAQCTACHIHSENGSYGASAFKATCYGCHGGGTAGTSQKNFWPDGNVNGADGSGSIDDAGEHQVHVTKLADRVYGETIAQLLTDNTAGNPALSSEAKQKALCAYCHLNPGADADHAGGTPADDAEVTQFKRIWNGAANDITPGAPVFTRAGGTCSNIDCHLDKTTPAGYAWYAGGASACIMCHRDITTGPYGTTGNTHSSHMNTDAAFSVYQVAMDCSTCHNNGPNWSTNTPPSANHINGVFNIGGTVSLTYDGTFPTAFGSCGANLCHNDGKGNLPKTSTYKWGDDIPGCSKCHDYPPATEAHAAHSAANGVIVTGDSGAAPYIDCYECHVGITPATHAMGTVSLKAAVGYTGNVTVGVAGFGSCGTNVCHNNGSGGAPAVPNPDWGTPIVAGSCTICHAGVPATGSHSAHIQGSPAITSYTSQGLTPTATEYRFNCTACHGSTLANHINGAKTVTVSNWNSGAKTCGQNSCHQNGAGAAPAQTVTWGTTPAGDPCAVCHGNSPTTGAHAAHEVGFHYNAIYSGTTGFLPVNGTAQTGHGNANSTVISCQICHNATVTVNVNARNATCAGCHNVGAGQGNAAIAIADKTKHVNSAKDVVFIDAKIRSKAQLRDSLSDVPELGNNWTRPAGYKAADGSSYDETPNTLYNSATFTSADKSCTVACHLWEAGRVDKVAPKWDSGAIMCIDCHSRLPK